MHIELTSDYITDMAILIHKTMGIELKGNPKNWLKEPDTKMKHAEECAKYSGSSKSRVPNTKHTNLYRRFILLRYPTPSVILPVDYGFLVVKRYTIEIHKRRTLHA